MELIIKKQSKRGDEILIPANTIQFVNTGIGIGQFMIEKHRQYMKKKVMEAERL